MSTETTTTTTQAGDGSATGGTGTSTSTGGGEWFGGFQDDLKGYVQNKGFKDPAAVVESYRNLEKLVGVKEKLLQVPDDLGSKDMDAVWNRLGRPDAPDKYGFKAQDEGFDKWAKETFHKAGLTANQAKAVIENFEAFDKQLATEAEGKFKAENELKVNDLKKEWGNAFQQNVNAAKAAAKQFGLDEAMINKMEAAIGFAPVMKMLQQIGAKVGEADFVGSSSTNGGVSKGILSPAQAQAKINELITNADWSSKYINGDVQAKNEMERLSKMAVGTYEV